MDENIIDAVAWELGVSYDDAEEFLKSETGCYANIGGESHWMSGKFIARLLKAVKENA